MVKIVFSYNKLIARVRAIVRREKIPLHWSKTRNERFDVHTVCVLYVLFQIEGKDYRMFSSWLAVAPALGLPSIPHWTTLQKAFSRLPPRLLRKLVQISGKCNDRIVAIDPTYYQLTNPSKGYCRRIGRDSRRDMLRKATVIVGTNKKKILDVFIRAKERHGMKDIHHLTQSKILKGRTVLADKEFDAEKFHQLVEDAGGKRSIVPLRNQNIPIHRTRGKHRKQLKRTGIPKIYNKRNACESNNSAVKRKLSPVLRGKTFWQQARDFYAKCFTYNLIKEITSSIKKTFYKALLRKNLINRVSFTIQVIKNVK